MLWATVILGMCLLTGIVVCIGLFAVRALQSVSTNADSFVNAHVATLSSLERIHARNAKQLDAVLDRFMALDFSLFKAYSSAEQADEGGFVDPADESDELLNTGTFSYTPGGNPVPHVSIDDLRAQAEEHQILTEDFTDEFFQREDSR
jgi:hypothetical protein